MQPNQKVNILLVDDKPSNLLALEAILESLGQSLVKARSGREALRRLLNDDFALILMDVQMPDMDGLETAALIRERDKTRHTPIIFLTAYERTDAQLFRGYSLGAVDYLTKPIVPEVLRAKVTVLVDSFRKTEEVKRQAELLHDNQQREHERRLVEEKQRWEMERLREEAAREKKAAQALAQKANELARTIAERVRAEEQERARARQQALVAELGQRALAGMDLETLMQEAVTVVAETLDVEFCAVLELLADGQQLLLRAGVGWKESYAGFATMDVQKHSQSVSPLLSEEPVIFEDLPSDARFREEALMHEHGVVSGMSVVIRGQNRPFGVLGAHTSRKRNFTRDDVYFLQTVANVLATAIQRKSDEQELAATKDELAVQLADMTRLHELSARLSNTLELQVVLKEVLTAVTALQSTSMGALLLHEPERHDLYTAASVGFSQEYLSRFGRLPLGPGSCAEVLLKRSGILIEDVDRDAAFAPCLSAAQLAGYRAVCSTPLLTRTGQIIGTIATYFSRPTRPSDRQLRVVELYARQATEAIDNARLYEEIQQANRRKDEFLAMLAHELRNPLAPILNALHIMHLRNHNHRDIEQARAIVERQVRHMTRLVDDLLDVSRIDRGKIELRKEPVELGEIVARAVESTKPFLETRGHDLEVVLPPAAVLLEADPTRLEQILANLLNNASKYTEPGGSVRLIAEIDGSELVLRVQDTGIGIAPEMLPHVFDMFMQADRSLDRAQGGLGIGLTLVRRLVELHGGSVMAYSAGLGQGSEFKVRLPLSNKPLAARPRATSPSNQSSGRTGRILVVDDSRDAAESLVMLLQLQGHEVRSASDGPGALEAARAFQPDVVLLDIGLPGMDGYEVARRLREEEGAQKVLLVAMTGYGQDEDRRRSAEAGFDHHLIKPVDLGELQEVLGRSEVLTPQ